MREGPIPCLTGSEGELVSVQIVVEPRLLEELLDALASVPFPINPEIYHAPAGSSQGTVVEFPAYSERLDDVYDSLRAEALTGLSVKIENMLRHIQSN